MYYNGSDSSPVLTQRSLGMQYAPRRFIYSAIEEKIWSGFCVICPSRGSVKSTNSGGK